MAEDIAIEDIEPAPAEAEEIEEVGDEADIVQPIETDSPPEETSSGDTNDN
jgi:hypothetical protein